MPRIVAHQSRQIEGHRKTCLALRQQVVIAPVGLLGSCKARELAHRPKLAAVHVAMDSAGIRKLAGSRNVTGGIECAEIVGTVDGVDGDSADGGKRAFGGLHYPLF